MSIEELRASAEIDLIVCNGVVVTVDKGRRIFRDGAVAVNDGVIVEVGTSSYIIKHYSPKRVIDAHGGVVHPGFVDAHVHSYLHLDRSTIPDEWSEELEHDQWRPYVNNLTMDDEYLSSTLAFMEMARNGTTTFCDMGSRHSVENIAAAARRIGLRGMVSTTIWDLPPHPEVSIGDTDQCVKEIKRQIKSLPLSAGERVWAGVGLTGMGYCSDGLLVKARELAEEHDLTMYMHQTYADADTEAYLVHTNGKPAIEHLADLGILGEGVQLVHVTRTDNGELDRLAESGTTVVHCPAASLRHGLGVSHKGRIPEMLKHGITVALGSDAGNQSDSLSVGRQAYLAATIHREARGQLPTISAEQAIEMSTINGARALGIEHLIGSIEIGKRADIVVRSTSHPEWHPCLDVITNLLYSASSVGVDTVLVDGEAIVEKMHLTRVVEEQEYCRIDEAAMGLRKRMDLRIQDRWPVICDG